MKGTAGRSVSRLVGYQVVVDFVVGVVASVMAFFFGYFTIASPASSEAVIRKQNRLSSLMLTESIEEEEISKLGDRDSVPKAHADADFNELSGENKRKGDKFCIQTIEDRPIIGLVGAHWNEASLIFQKSWDGNGTPNSTNKYKEDQKVRWHSTPFEERLEKALSMYTTTPSEARHVTLISRIG